MYFWCWGSGLGLYRLESLQACQVIDVSSVGFAAFGFQVSFLQICIDLCRFMLEYWTYGIFCVWVPAISHYSPCVSTTGPVFTWKVGVPKTQETHQKRHVGGHGSLMRYPYPPGKIFTYPTLGKGKSSTQKCLGRGYVIVPRRVSINTPYPEGKTCISTAPRVHVAHIFMHFDVGM